MALANIFVGRFLGRHGYESLQEQNATVLYSIWALQLLPC